MIFAAIFNAIAARMAGHAVGSAVGSHAVGAATESASHGALANVGADHLAHAQNLGAGINEAAAAAGEVAAVGAAATMFEKSSGVRRG